MPELNLIAVLACGVASMVIGGLWYAPFLLGKAWQREAGLSDEQMAGANMAKILGLTFVLSLIAAYVFGMFIGTEMPLGAAVAAGFSAGLCWVGAAFGINYLFERRSLKLWLINAGYHTLQFAAFGLIFGLMN